MKEEFLAVGRRKASVARVVMRPGTGKVLVNNREINEYFNRDCHRIEAMSPIVLCEATTKYDYILNVKGGGQTGQAGAIKLALARALDKSDESLRGKMKTAGMLTRDARVVERKKFGLAGARRGYQFSKR